MIWIAIGIYAVVISYFVIRAQHHSTSDEFLMADRSANTAQVGAGIFTLIGGGEFVTLASLGFIFGWSGISLFVGYALGFFFLGAIAKTFRINSKIHKYISLPDYVHHEFGFGSGFIAFLFSIAAFFSLLMLQFSAAGVIVSPFLNVSESLIIFFVGFWVTAYLAVGGFKAVLTTDVIQGIAMAILLPFLVFIIVNNTTISISYSGVETPSIGLWSSLVFTGFFVVAGSADVWQRGYSAKDDKTASIGFYLGGTAFLLFGFVIVAIGMIARSIGIDNPDNAFVLVMTEHLPPYAASLVAVLVLCAMMSTADTETFLLTGLIAHECNRIFPSSSISKLFNTVKGVRLLVCFIGVLATFFAFFYNDLVGIYTWLLSALVVISPIILFSLFIKSSPMGMLISLIMNIILFILLLAFKFITLDNIYLLAIPGFSIYVFSLLSRKKAS